MPRSIKGHEECKYAYVYLLVSAILPRDLRQPRGSLAIGSILSVTIWMLIVFRPVMLCTGENPGGKCASDETKTLGGPSSGKPAII